MSKNTLVAVGGSGQSAAIAYLRMATLSGMPAEDLPNIYVIDADVKDRAGADAQPSLFSSLSTLFEELTRGVAKNQRPMLALIYPYVANGQSNSLGASVTFAEYMLGRMGNREDMQHALDAIFSRPLKDSEDLLSEQDVPLAKGFMARPNVGATTFFDKLNQKNKMDDHLSRLRDSVTVAQNQGVTVVIGSTFGGTGSGVAPSLAQQLADWATKASQTPRVGLFMTLPWFSPNGAKTNADAAPSHGKAEVQKKNTAGGLRYYANSKTLNDSVDVFLADFGGKVQTRNDDSNSEQPEYEHVFNLILAAQIQNYFINKVENTAFAKAGAYTFYLSQKNASNQLEINAADCALLAFSVSGKVRQDVQHWAHEAQTVRLALKYVADFILRGFKLTNAAERKIPQGLTDLAKASAERDGRPGLITVSKGFLGIGKSELISEEIYQCIARKMLEREQQLAKSVAWLQSLKNSSPELKIDDISLLARPESEYRKYPVVKHVNNAETAETVSVYVFEQSLQQANNVRAPFEQRVDNGQHFFDAAAFEVERHLRNWIRQHTLSTTRRGDEQGSDQDGTVVPFLPVQTSTASNAVNRYLHKINLRAVVDDGKDRHGQSIRRLDKSHPASLSELEHFSVPSPWGAALVEEWQQRTAYDLQADSPEGLDVAAERLEAILWGIFTKKLHIRAIDADLAGTVAYTALKVRDMEVGVQSQDTRFVVAINPHNQQVMAANYPTVGWFANPSLKKLRGQWWDPDGLIPLTLPSTITTRLTGSEPSSYELQEIRAFDQWLEEILLKHGNSSSDDAATWSHIVTRIKRRLRVNLFDQVVAAPIEAQPYTFVLLCAGQQLKSIAVQTLGKPREEIIDAACMDTLLVLQNEITHPNGDISYNNTFPDSPLKTTQTGSARRIAESNVACDAQGEYFWLTFELTLPEGQFTVRRKAYVASSFRAHSVIWPKFTAPDWKFYFVGSETRNLEIIRHQRYAYALYGQDADGRYELLQTKVDGRLTNTYPMLFEGNYEVQGVPKVMVLLQKNKRPSGDYDEHYTEAGMIDIRLKKLDHERRNQFKLGLDFGTSHSCITALDGDNKPIQLDFSGAQSGARNDLMLTMINWPQGEERVKSAFLFLPPVSAEPMTSDKDVLPSEFKWHTVDRGRVDPSSKIDAGIRYLSILPMRFSDTEAEGQIKVSGALGDFKWGASREKSSLTGTDYEGKEADLSQQYIQQLLRMAMALLRLEGYAVLKTFRATYPEAFSTVQAELYAQKLQEVLLAVLPQSGVVCNQDITKDTLLLLKRHSEGLVTGEGLDDNSHGLISESHAALVAAKVHQRTALVDKGVRIVLDMGGGSTDVAAFVNPDYLPNRDRAQPLPPTLTDSVKYAGHDVLKMLATTEVIKALDPDFSMGAEDDREKRSLGILKIGMRDQKAVQRLQMRLTEASFAQKEKQNVKQFFEGMFEYTRQLILSYQQHLSEQGTTNLKVGIVLLGNAWRLGNLVYTEAGLTNVDGVKYDMHKYLTTHLSGVDEIGITFPSSDTCSVKQSIASGALLYSPLEDSFNNGESAKSSNIRTRHGFVGCLDLSGELQDVESGYFAPQQAVENRRVVEAPVLGGLDIFPKSSNFLRRMDEHPHFDGQGLHFARIEMNMQLKRQWVAADDKIVLSPMRDFLEHIWKPVLSTRDS